MSEPEDKAEAGTSEDTRTVFRSPDALSAELISLILALFQIRGVVFNNADFFLGVIVFAEVMVLASDRDHATRAIAALHATRHTEEWRCPDCEETVPDTFDLCWNCGKLHPELDDEHGQVVEAISRPSESGQMLHGIRHADTSGYLLEDD